MPDEHDRWTEKLLLDEALRPLIPNGDLSFKVNKVELTEQVRKIVDQTNGLKSNDDFLPGWHEVRSLPIIPCSPDALDGSWYLVLKLSKSESSGLNEAAVSRCTGFHGALRVEMNIPREEQGSMRLKISGDLYKCESFGEVLPFDTDSFKEFCYPHLPQLQESWAEEYTHYFHSSGHVFHDGKKLVSNLTCYSWDSAQSDFVARSKTCWIKLNCNQSRYKHGSLRSETLKLCGWFGIDGNIYEALAYKTSPYYRGCYLYVAEMQGTSWPHFGRNDDNTTTFAGVFRQHGIDIRGEIVNAKLPRSEDLSDEISYLEIVKRSCEYEKRKHVWRMILLIAANGSTEALDAKGKRHKRSVIGIMRDDQMPFREGATGFYGARLAKIIEFREEAQKRKLEPEVGNNPLGQAPLGFLRTLLHEAGHIFGLPHTSESDPEREEDTTIMYSTGDIIRGKKFAKFPDLVYPRQAKFEFTEGEAMLLAHAPDPQIAPGRMRYRWIPGLWVGGVLPRKIDGWS